MKKHAFTNLLKLAALFAFAAVIISCSGLADIENKIDSGSRETASIEIKIGSSVARQIAPVEEYFNQMATIKFFGKQTDGNATYEKPWIGGQTPSTYNPGETYWTSAYYKLQEDPIVKDIPFGNWAFTLECYNKDGALICSGKTEKTLKPGNNGAIVIELENVEGNGSIEIELSLDSLQNLASLSLIKTYDGDIKTTDQNGETTTVQNTGKGVYSIKASLKKLDGTVVENTDTLTLEIVTTTNDNYSVFYSKEEIPAGSYIVSFMFYEKQVGTEDVLLTTVSELVNVVHGLTTSSGEYHKLYLNSLNQSYAISYKYSIFDSDGNFESAEDFDTSWLVGENKTLSASYTEYDTIVLPTEILREGYSITPSIANEKNYRLCIQRLVQLRELYRRCNHRNKRQRR